MKYNSRIPCLVGIGFLCPVVASAVEFNEHFLTKGGAPVELHFFEQGNGVLPGSYGVDIYLNQVLIKRQDVDFRGAADGEVRPDISLGTLRALGVDIVRLEKEGLIPASSDDARLINIAALLEGASVDFDVTNLALHISVPHAYILRRSRGYVDPTLWDQGITALYTNYQINVNRNENSGARSDYRYIGLRNGFNLKGWRFRNESSLSGGSGRPNTFSSNRSYLERDLASLKGKLAMGDLYSQGDIFDSVRFRGAQVTSDLGMLTDGERGYAPVVRGIAESNATVEVRQNGYVIYSTTVSPGAFEISDIYPGGSNGDLKVKIIEADGREREFSQAYSYLPVMARRGSMRYSLAAGKYNVPGRPSPKFTQSTLVYGLTNNFTGYGGLLVAQKYKALNVGVGINSSLGGVSVDITSSASEDDHGKKNKGQSARFLYSKTVNSTNTTFTMVGYRYSTDGYRTLNQHVDEMDLTMGRRNGRQKSHFDMNVSQAISKHGSLFLSLGETSYWNVVGRTRRWQAGYSGSLSRGSYSLAVSKTKNSDHVNSSDTQLTASFSFPLGERSSTHYVNSSAVSSQHGDSVLQTGVSGYLDDKNTVNYSAQSGYSKQSGSSGGIGVGWDAPVATLGARYNQSSDSKHVDLSASGSIVAHEGGITFGQPVGETFALVEVPNVAGVGVDSYNSVRTDNSGYAVVPYVQPYRYNWLNLDTNTIDSNMEVAESSKIVVPTRGAVVKSRFAAESGRRLQFNLTLDTGGKIPFGAQAYDKKGKALGAVDSLSRLLVFGVDDSGTLSVRWGRDSCRFDYALPVANKNLAYEKFNYTCVYSGSSEEV
ncbi:MULTISPECIES: fimbria/pilus outer membrane usher protein [unclassified Pseudomonas]|uniref:fimbria/pilus outer membrane usher protein n=1 Tax=unclassified Pseudomonas TaxID=196821 RepID=UPI000F6C6C26|nr:MULTISPECIES: fimbria/pilus outer membrane usher protein [unclassified Pseudomonas]AZF03589.1 Outer membrane usher protein FIMD [Pseudomonas sp. R5-89-07]AZF46060.1 Outer membrane usher protein FIMD [Pseudomonas sp. R2-7-07]